MKKLITKLGLLTGIIGLTSCSGITAKFMYPDNMKQLAVISTTPVFDKTT